jgi:hypothetical protein
MAKAGQEILPVAVASEPQHLNHIPDVVASLNRGAAQAKRTGHFYLAITLTIGTFILLLFAFANTLTYFATGEFDINLARYARPPTGITDIKDAIDSINKAAGNDQTLRTELLELLKSDLDRPEEPSISPFSSALSVISGSVVRIGAVLVGIFLIQLMVGFARYYYKLAEHLRCCATSINLSAGRLNDLQTVVPLLMPSGIEFGKIPNSPIEKLADTALKTVEEVSKKIPIR